MWVGETKSAKEEIDGGPWRGAASLGFQIGGQKAEVILMIMNRKAPEGERLEYISLEGDWYKLKGAKGKTQEWVHKSVVTSPP